jgi:hypothetical protein
MAKIENTPENAGPTRVQRILTAMIVGVIGTAILSIAVLIASAAFGWKGLFAIFGPLASIGMLAGMLLMIELFVVSVIEKARQNRSNQ